MQQWYVDQTGRQLGTYDGPEEECPYPGAIAVPTAPADVFQRWDVAWQHWYSVVEVLQERKVAQIATRFDAAIAAGMAYQGKVLQIREQDQATITTMGNEARWAKVSGTAWPADFAWRMADDTFLAIPTADAMIALGEAAKAEVYRLRRCKWAHVDAVRSLTDAASIEVYDIETYWVKAE